MRYLTIVAAAVLAALAVVPVAAAERPQDPFLATVARDFDRSADRLVRLAEAIPESSYGWRPAEGVRSIGEALLHVAGSNYVLAGGLGAPVPDDLTYELADPGPGLIFDMETTITARAEILATLRDSIDRARRALLASDGSDLDASVELLSGNALSRRDVAMILATHQNQHLGQTVAYARTVGVVPPWSVPGS